MMAAARQGDDGSGQQIIDVLAQRSEEWLKSSVEARGHIQGVMIMAAIRSGFLIFSSAIQRAARIDLNQSRCAALLLSQATASCRSAKTHVNGLESRRRPR